MVNWQVGKEDKKLIFEVAKRAVDFCSSLDELTVVMDLTACHANGCPLNLSAMCEADEFNLMHDVLGINRHICHETGQLQNCFVPRFVKKQSRRGGEPCR